MKWLPTTADEHVLCDDRGVPSEYRVRRDPVTLVYSAFDGQLRIAQHLAIYPVQRACEARYVVERGSPGAWRPNAERSAEKPLRKPRRGRYSKRGAA